MRIACCLLTYFIFYQVSLASPAYGPDDFVRYNSNLESAISTYSGAEVEVDLVSALHVADRAYFQELNKRFKGYDAVLFELVAEKRHTRTRNLATKKDGSAVSAVQNGLAELLDLSFQLDEVDYSPGNFVHADLSPTEFKQEMDNRGESTIGLLLKLMAASKRTSEQTSVADDIRSINIVRLLMKPPSDERAMGLKRAFAAEFSKMGAVLEDLSGGGGTALLEGRNDRAIEVLGEQMRLGKKKIAIFYGGAHLPDMAKKLVDDFGLKYSGTEWIVAWNLEN